MTAYTKMVEAEGTLTGLEAYSASRPPHSEGLAVTIASYLAHETALPNINLLHLSSRKAIEAAMMMAKTFPHIDFRREVTIGHLLADIDTASGHRRQGQPADASTRGRGGAVGAPARRRRSTGLSATTRAAATRRSSANRATTCSWRSPGFGGTEYLLPGLVSEGPQARPAATAGSRS